MSPDELEQQKDIQFHAASVNAWYNTSLERDKSVLTLSAGGIGLLLTLLSAIKGCVCLLVCYVTAILCFLVSLVAVLLIFQHNRTHIEQTLAKTAPKSDPWLEKLDFAAMSAFGAGAAFTAIIGISVAIGSFLKKESSVTNETKNLTSAPVELRESFNRASALQGADLGKSFNRVGNLQQQPAASTPAPGAPAPAAATPAAPAPATTAKPQDSGK